jgi:ketosteroid isomerase-like protein
MSEKNVEIVRRANAEMAQGNFWIPDLFDPEVRIRWLDAIGAVEETVGLQAMSDFMVNWMSSFEGLTLEAERIIDAGDEVVVIAAWRGRGKASGVDTEWRHASVWALRNGRVASIVAYPDPSDALKAAGLSE